MSSIVLRGKLIPLFAIITILMVLAACGVAETGSAQGTPSAHTGRKCSNDPAGTASASMTCSRTCASL